MGITFDYHTHHQRCGHADGEMADYVEAATKVGLTEFGVSDHCPMLFFPGDDPAPQTAMAKSEIGDYVAEAQALKERYAGRLAVKIGIEADFVEGWENAYRELLSIHPFDYVLGSVHWVRDRNIFDRTRWEQENPAATYTEYYRLLAAAAGSGLFDIMSHLTAVEAYGPPIGEELSDLLYPPVVAAITKAGAAVEVNTSGFRKMGGDDPFPNRKLLRLLAAAGVPLTFGSDAHRPEEVGYARDQVEVILQDLDINIDAPRPWTTVRGPIQAFLPKEIR